MGQPIAYHITFTTYGTRLHGDERGSVDDAHNTPGTPFRPADAALQAHRQDRMKGSAVTLDARMRGATYQAIAEVCDLRFWVLHQANIRTNHIHTVVAFPLEVAPDKVMGDFKAYATRRMRRRGLVKANQRVWTAKGSKRPVFDEDGLARVVFYVQHEQGPDLPMEFD